MAGVRLHAQAKRMKEQLVADKGIADLAPLVIVKTDTEDSFFGHCGPGLQDALAAGTRMGDVLAASIMTLRGEHDMIPLSRMMLVIEGYAKIGADPEAMAAVEHGDLVKDFTTNPDSDVSETLMTNLWSYQNGDIVFELWITSFRYTDGGVLVWDQEFGPMTDGEGDLPDAGKRVMRSE